MATHILDYSLVRTHYVLTTTVNEDDNITLGYPILVMVLTVALSISHSLMARTI